jgi:hypothetical protein
MRILRILLIAPAAQLRLLLLTTLLLGTTLVLGSEQRGVPQADSLDVFSEPPAYLHPQTAIRFDTSGLQGQSAGQVEEALRASMRGAADASTRAHTHMSLAVYYKMQGLPTLAETEKRKGDYWQRVAKFLEPGRKRVGD